MHTAPHTDTDFASILKKATAKWRVCEEICVLSLLDEIWHFENKAGP